MKREDKPSSARCLCSYPEAFAKAEPRKPALVWAVYHVPAHTTAVSVGFHNAGLTAPLPISPGGSGSPLDGEPDAAAITASFPNTVALSTRLSGAATSVAESEKEVDIALNTDVLFAFDKATLTSRAQETLRATAERISADAKGTVKIVGHTDDVGGDAYNMGLSLRRANAVDKALTEVIFERELPPPPPPSRAPVAPTQASVSTAEGVRKLTGLTADLTELRRIGDRATTASPGTACARSRSRPRSAPGGRSACSC
jgi:hypothetical protein